MAAQDISDVVAEKHFDQAGSCKASQEDRVNLKIDLQEYDASCEWVGMPRLSSALDLSRGMWHKNVRSETNAWKALAE